MNKGSSGQKVVILKIIGIAFSLEFYVAIDDQETLANRYLGLCHFVFYVKYLLMVMFLIREKVIIYLFN